MSQSCSRCGRAGHYAPSCSFPESKGRTCRMCGKHKPKSDYPKLSGRCRPCMRIYNRDQSRKLRKRLRSA